MIRRIYELGERRCKKMNLAEDAGTYLFDGIECPRLEVQTVGDHEPGRGLCSRAKNLIAFLG
jgi:hypothetical protein